LNGVLKLHPNSGLPVNNSSKPKEREFATTVGFEASSAGDFDIYHHNHNTHHPEREAGKYRVSPAAHAL